MWTCPGGHDLRAIKLDQHCSCGDTHTHLQGQCDTCGYVTYIHPNDQTKATDEWNAAHDNPEEKI